MVKSGNDEGVWALSVPARHHTGWPDTLSSDRVIGHRLRSDQQEIGTTPELAVPLVEKSCTTASMFSSSAVETANGTV